MILSFCTSAAATSLLDWIEWRALFGSASLSPIKVVAIIVNKARARLVFLVFALAGISLGLYDVFKG